MMSSAEKRAKLLSGLLAQRGEAAPAKPDALEPKRPSEVIHFSEHRAEAAGVLYSKGAATADTFRPTQWSFEKQIPPAAAAVAQRESGSNRLSLLAVLSCLALMVSAGILVLSRTDFGPSAPAPQPPVARVETPAPPRVEMPAPAVPEQAIVIPEPAPPASAAPAVVPPPEAPAPVETAAVVPAPQPEPAAESKPPADPQEIAGLFARGDMLLGTGDVVSARLFYQRAAELGSGLAATAVGQTYDPLFLEVARVRGVRGDSQAAAEWYRKAVALGDRQAEIRLRRLEAKPPG